MHVTLFGFFVETFQFLRRRFHIERAGGQRLRLSPRKDRRTVYAGKYRAFAPDRTHVFQSSAIGTDALIEDLRADLFFIQIINTVFDFSRVFGIYFRKVFESFLFHLLVADFTFLSVRRVDRPFDFLFGKLADFLIEFFGNVIEFDFEFRFARLGNDFFFDKLADFLDLLMTEHDGADHFVVRHFIRARFDHENRVFGSRKIEVDRTLFTLRTIGIDDVFAVCKTYDNRTSRSRPRDIGNCDRNGRSDHGKRFGRNIGLDRKRGGDHHNVVKQPLGEQRTKRTVDEARR